AEQLALFPEALRPWICRISGRHVYFSRDLFPLPSGERYQPQQLEKAGLRLAKLLAHLPPFYAHFGGAGDLLLLLASFYDQTPKSVLFSHPNSIGATQALLEGFPELSQIYFLPQHTEPFFHIILRYAVYELKNCLGAGTTPKDGYDVEWKAGLNIEKKYGIKKSPQWAARFRQNKGSRKVAVAPKGSLSGMVGTKRNIIDPGIWTAVIEHIQDRGFEPVIFGVASEAIEYPALPGCVDARTETFFGQMQSIGRCAGLVGADSWAKSFTALAQIPTVVFEPLKGADLAGWKDASDWVFIEPWQSIKMVNSLDSFRRAFDVRIAHIPDPAGERISKPNITWEGSFLDYASLSHINRELTDRLATTFCVSRVGSRTMPATARSDSNLARCSKQLVEKAPANSTVTVRHQWPPNWSKPASGLLVVIQPWEYGALPKDWISASATVDEFWVPSPLVRDMYLDSGIEPQKVRVVPNGVDTNKYRPGIKPMALETKKKFKFLFVGGTIFRKGPDILLEAFVRAFSAKDDVCLVIKDFGGDSCYQGQTAEEVIRKLKLKPGTPEILHLTKNFSAEEMPSLYAACDCLVLPYRGEGFGMPVLEAMSCGLPVIVTDGGATDSFVTREAGWRIPSDRKLLGDHVGNIPLAKNGWLREPLKEELAAIFKTAANNPAECRRRGAIGREIAVKRFDWNDIAASVAHRLKELAEMTPVPPTSIPPAKEITAQERSTKIPEVVQVGQLKEARQLVAQKQFEAAWSAVTAVLALRPFHPEAFLLLAKIALKAGDASSARKCAQFANGLAPSFSDAKQFLEQPLQGGITPNWLKLPVQIQKDQATKLSVCLIVKDEEKFLRQCLQSIRNLANQIVVVDTGSTDRTVEIAREFGAEVYSFIWSDDFAAARNEALKHATGDWVLMLDADEELPVTQHAKLLEDIENSDVIGYRLPLVDIGKEAEGRSHVPRLYRNAPGLYYTGRIHEQIFGSLLLVSEGWGIGLALGTAEILHHGYTRESVRDRNKVERNLNLLKLAISENDRDVNLIMNLGLELVRSGDLTGGLVQYREAFEMMSVQPTAQVVPELREVLLTQLTSHLYKIGAQDEVVRTLTSPLAKRGGLTASLHLALGLAAFELKDYQMSADQMRQCLDTRNAPALSPINVEIHGAAPWHCLALSLARLKDAAGAEKAFRAAASTPGAQEIVKLDYARFLAQENRPVEALEKLNELIAINSKLASAWSTGGEIALSRTEFAEFACDWTGEAIRALPEDTTILTQRAEALTLYCKAAEAAKVWQRLGTLQPGPRQQAALTLCELVANSAVHGLKSNIDELSVSRSFIEWYQKLIRVQANSMVGGVNGRLKSLAHVLPTAGRILEEALAESSKSFSA
ncbi:MAG: hypothetical protein JWM99_4971, partial [Verrucomicrobiales bacterium]|nr:hypothetical protein [Verrucomicrobiales bacterium]